jgi:hypothetical protein
MSGTHFHKGVCALAIAGLLWFAPRHAKAQDAPPPHLVQGVVRDLRNAHQAADLADLFRSQPGVIMARVDHVTSNVMLHVQPWALLDLDEVHTLLAERGYTLRCHRRSVVGASPFRHVDPATCDAPQPAR